MPRGESPIEIVGAVDPTRYDPRWVAAQLRLALKLLGWLVHGSDLVNPDTGERIAVSASPTELAETLLGRPLSIRRKIEAEMGAKGWQKSGAA